LSFVGWVDGSWVECESGVGAEAGDQVVAVADPPWRGILVCETSAVPAVECGRPTRPTRRSEVDSALSAADAIPAHQAYSGRAVRPLDNADTFDRRHPVCVCLVQTTQGSMGGSARLVVVAVTYLPVE
jgi:hypothetical protein